MDLSEIKKAVSDITAKKRTLDRKREGLILRREELETLPICKQDLLELLSDSLDKLAITYKDQLQLQLNSSYLTRGAMKLPSGKFPLLAPWSPNNQGYARDFAIAALLKDAIMKSLPDLLDEMEMPKDAGPPISSRKTEIAQIDDEISTLDQEISNLREAANGAGIRL